MFRGFRSGGSPVCKTLPIIRRCCQAHDNTPAQLSQPDQVSKEQSFGLFCFYSKVYIQILENAALALHTASPPPTHLGKQPSSGGRELCSAWRFPCRAGEGSVALPVKIINNLINNLKRMATLPPPKSSPTATACFPVLCCRRAKPCASTSHSVSL